MIDDVLTGWRGTDPAFDLRPLEVTGRLSRIGPLLARRQEAAAQKANNPSRADGVDPDLEGIKPGPQPLQDWQVE